MFERDRYRRRSGTYRPTWTSVNEAQLQQALEDGDERSLRRWQGRRYGVVW